MVLSSATSENREVFVEVYDLYYVIGVYASGVEGFLFPTNYKTEADALAAINAPENRDKVKECVKVKIQREVHTHTIVRDGDVKEISMPFLGE